MSDAVLPIPETAADARKVLAVSPTASEKDIKAAWRREVQRSHPDRHPGDPTAARRFRAVQEAYRLLTDPFVMEQERRALARGPNPPYTRQVIEAFRLLSLGPGASYDDIEQRYRALRARGPVSHEIRDAYELLLSERGDSPRPSAEASAAWFGPSRQESQPPPLVTASTLRLIMALAGAACLGVAGLLWADNSLNSGDIRSCLLVGGLCLAGTLVTGRRRG